MLRTPAGRPATVRRSSSIGNAGIAPFEGSCQSVFSERRSSPTVASSLTPKQMTCDVTTGPDVIPLRLIRICRGLTCDVCVRTERLSPEKSSVLGLRLPAAVRYP
jgi:hypothetical protein